MESGVTIQDIRSAHEKISGVVQKTPLEYSRTFSEIYGAQIFFKQENAQRTGSFKIRGAYNKICSLSESEKTKGVIAASAGNHAQGTALAAQIAGIAATIVMPETAPISKYMATRGYGANVLLRGAGYDEAYAAAKQIQEELGSTFIHAFNDPLIIAGQGTIALEILDQLADLDAVVVPVGGGGMLAGIATAVKAIRPEIKVIGVQAAGAPSMLAAKQKGHVEELSHVDTIADGIAIKKPGELAFGIIDKLVDDLITVSDEEIAQAILMLLERNKIVAEGAGAVGVAAVLHQKLGSVKGKIAVVISGGNIDVNLISTLIERGLTLSGRRVRLRTVLLDKPGNLQRLLELIAKNKANVISVVHDRTRPTIKLNHSEVELTLETRDSGHVDEITANMENHGYSVGVIYGGSDRNGHQNNYLN